MLKFMRPIEIQVDLCNCCSSIQQKSKLTYAIVIRPRQRDLGCAVRSKSDSWKAFEEMDAHRPTARFSPLYKRYLVLLNMKIGKVKRREKTQDSLGIVWENLMQLLRSNTYHNYGPICISCTVVDLWQAQAIDFRICSNKISSELMVQS